MREMARKPTMTNHPTPERSNVMLWYEDLLSQWRFRILS